MNMNDVVMLRRSEEVAVKIATILGVDPDVPWANAHIEFGTDSLATCTIDFLLTPEQLHALVDLGAVRTPQSTMRSGEGQVADATTVVTDRTTPLDRPVLDGRTHYEP